MNTYAKPVRNRQDPRLQCGQRSICSVNRFHQPSVAEDFHNNSLILRSCIVSSGLEIGYTLSHHCPPNNIGPNPLEDDGISSRSSKRPLRNLYGDWYDDFVPNTGPWWVGCYISYKDEGHEAPASIGTTPSSSIVPRPVPSSTSICNSLYTG